MKRRRLYETFPFRWAKLRHLINFVILSMKGRSFVLLKVLEKNCTQILESNKKKNGILMDFKEYLQKKICLQTMVKFQVIVEYDLTILQTL